MRGMRKERIETVVLTTLDLYEALEHAKIHIQTGYVMEPGRN